MANKKAYLKFLVDIVGHLLAIGFEQLDLFLDRIEHVVVRVGLLSHSSQMAHHGNQVLKVALFHLFHQVLVFLFDELVQLFQAVLLFTRF